MSPIRKISGTFFVLLILALFPASLPLAEEAPRKGIDYTVAIEGDAPDDLQDLLEQSSRLIQLQSKPPFSIRALRRRTEEDVDGLVKVLRAEGYYDGRVTSRIDPAAEPNTVRLQVEVGPRYTISGFRIAYAPRTTSPDPIRPEELGITLGMAARSEAVATAQKLAILKLGYRGFPQSRLVDQDIVVDYATKKMDVALTIDAGPRLTVGSLNLEGLTAVEEAYVRTVANWPEGALYDTRAMDQVRRDLVRTGLFEAVRMKPLPSHTGDGAAPVTLVLVEREHRSIGAGTSWSTSEGLGAELFWEHRNFFGAGEKLRADIAVGEIRQEMKAGFAKPNFGRLDQNLKAEISYAHENNDAYTEDTIHSVVGVDRRVGDHWIIGGGLSLEFSQIDEMGKVDEFALLGLPLAARYDSTDDLLDPTRGIRFGAEVTPYLGLNGEAPDFIRSELFGSAYYDALDNGRVVLAARGKIGAMAGDSTDDIPASKRFYSGGGGSIRGYQYQAVGPLDANNDPAGGRSLVEIGAEARIRITDAIGVVPFIEGGNVYESMAPDFSEAFQWGAGLGVRYHTAVGPIRFDVAVPLNKRDGVDDAFQFYISIGQAF
ncbi:autotransporter assembly complex protein TamA [Sneathiella chinensis]|uniref:autotransporter assembly complex protein TamA n=1 Tax=Sneathiella chinensis TaxID=349750 RepID=UPI0024E0BAB5|nr:autotransporter assembly complex family protein [Sneathiella chinensis]